MYVVVIVGSLLNALPLLTTRSMTYESATGNDPNNIFELDSIEIKCVLFVSLEDLSRDASREQIKETILDIASSCDIAVDTLSDMLTYDKVESKNMTLERSSISLKNFFEETLRPFYLQAKFKNISLRLSVQCDTDIYHRNPPRYLKVEVIDSGAGISE
eukprot:gene8829-18281_t